MKFQFISKVPEMFPGKDEQVQLVIGADLWGRADITVKVHIWWEELERQDGTVFEITFRSKSLSPVALGSGRTIRYVKVACSPGTGQYHRTLKQVVRQTTDKLIDTNLKVWLEKRQSSFDF